MATKQPKPAARKAAAGASTKGANQPVDAFVHSDKERLFIPSREEAGQEMDGVADRPTVREVPLNPVTHRGQDPELYWLNKYGADDAQTRLEIDIRSLYRHEHIEPEQLIARLYKLKNRDEAQNDLFVNEFHGNPLPVDELDKPIAYYFDRQGQGGAHAEGRDRRRGVRARVWLQVAPDPANARAPGGGARHQPVRRGEHQGADALNVEG